MRPKLLDEGIGLLETLLAATGASWAAVPGVGYILNSYLPESGPSTPLLSLVGKGANRPHVGQVEIS